MPPAQDRPHGTLPGPASLAAPPPAPMPPGQPRPHGTLPGSASLAAPPRAPAVSVAAPPAGNLAATSQAQAPRPGTLAHTAVPAAAQPTTPAAADLAELPGTASPAGDLTTTSPAPWPETPAHTARPVVAWPTGQTAGYLAALPPDPALPVSSSAAGPETPAHTAGLGAEPHSHLAPMPTTTEAVPGIADWARCFAEELRLPRAATNSKNTGPWRVIAAEDQPFGPVVARKCPSEPLAGQTLAVVGDAADPGTPGAALKAAADAIRTGRLTVISPGPGLNGFWASLHAENPELGITLLRADGPDAFPAALAVASAEPGVFRELDIDVDGRVTEPVMVPAETPAGDFPLGPADVVVIGRNGGGAALAMAQVLACCGASIAVIGEPGPDEDSKLIIGIERLRAAGTRVSLEITDPADQASMAATLQRIQSERGPVTAVVHTARATSPRRVAGLTEPEFRANATASPAALRDLIALLRPDLIRTIITFGSVAGRYGLAGQGLLALASAALAEQAGRLAASLPRCRAVHIDIPGWSGRGLGERADLTAALAAAGVTSLLVKDGARLLLRLLAAPGLPSRVAVHGRIGPGVPAAIAAAACDVPQGRFTRGVRLHYPGVELVADTEISLRTDPYLADHRPGGQPSLPVAMALEAMAQAASELAGGPVRRVKGASVVAQIPVPADGTARLRVCALREGGTIRAVVRCEASAFVVDHVRAVFASTGADPGDTRPPAALPAGPPAAGPPAAEPVTDESAHVGSAAIVDGSELYGTVCFPTGRLRRVAFLPGLSPRGLRALASGTDDEPWFSPDADPAGAPLILGNPGLNDATVHVLQACVPHRRLVVAGCESVVFSGRQTDGVAEIRAAAIPPAGRELAGNPPAGGAPETAQAEAPGPVPVPSSPQPVPSQRSPGRRAAPGPAEYHWDVDAVDAAGHLLVSWRGLRLRDAGPRPRPGSWPASMLPVYLESCAVALGLDARLRVSIAAASPAVPGFSQATVGTAADSLSRADDGGPAGLALVVGPAPLAAGCWRVVSADRPGPATGPLGGPAAGGLGRRLAERLAEPAGPLAARIRAIEACLPPGPGGQGPGETGAGAELVLDDAVLDDWVVLRAGAARLACTVVQISGVASPVAVALVTGLAVGQPAPPPPRFVAYEETPACTAGGREQGARLDPAEAAAGEAASAEVGGLPWVWLWAGPASG
jgi:enediyne polyketide synthase